MLPRSSIAPMRLLRMKRFSSRKRAPMKGAASCASAITEMIDDSRATDAASAPSHRA